MTRNFGASNPFHDLVPHLSQLCDMVHNCLVFLHVEAQRVLQHVQRLGVLAYDVTWWANGRTSRLNTGC